MMKIAFNSEERQLHIVAGGASHFSEYVDGFRFELRSKNTDLRQVVSSLRDAVCAIGAIVDHIAVMDPEEESAPGIMVCHSNMSGGGGPPGNCDYRSK